MGDESSEPYGMCWHADKGVRWMGEKRTQLLLASGDDLASCSLQLTPSFQLPLNDIMADLTLENVHLDDAQGPGRELCRGL